MAISNRYEFVLIFDVENGNPNGDPEYDNSPRMDMDTHIGYITDVCLKRKIRNYVELVKDGEPGYGILIKPDKFLNAKFSDVYDILGLKNEKSGKDKNDVQKARDYMCKNYFDVRTFGAVMSTGDKKCGTVRGPVQLCFAKSISPINIQNIIITRQARTNEERSKTGDTEFGRKSLIPYALYRADGYISAALAQKVTGLSDDDVELLWEAIINMFENDRSAARGKMSMRKLYIFKHDNVLGCCPSNTLFDKIEVKANNPAIPPRSFSDYTVTVDESMPAGVEFISKI